MPYLQHQTVVELGLEAFFICTCTSSEGARGTDAFAAASIDPLLRCRGLCRGGSTDRTESHTWKCKYSFVTTQAIGGPHTGDVDDEAYVLDLEDFDDLDDTFAGELVNRISIACANNVEVTGVIATGVGKPTNLACTGSTCTSDGETAFLSSNWYCDV